MPTASKPPLHASKDSGGSRVPAGGIYIGLGSNLGDRAAHITGGLRNLAERGDIRVLRVSTLHETQPVGGPPQGAFLNGVAELETALPARELLHRLQEVEARHGRVRSVPNAPRTLDLDLLLYGDERIHEAGLIVPHPRMWEREFVLRPLAELRPDLRRP